MNDENKCMYVKISHEYGYAYNFTYVHINHATKYEFWHEAPLLIH